MCVEASENTKQGIFLPLKGPQGVEQGYFGRHTLTGQGVWWLVVLEGVREQCNRGAGCSLGTVWPDTRGWLFLECITVKECGKMTATAGGRLGR